MSDDWPDLFGDLPPFVRGSDTSLQAAIEAEPNAGTQRRRVLDELRKHGQSGLTDHQLQELLSMNPSTERPRRIELVAAKFVVDSGRRRLTPSGRQAVVWVVVDPHLDAGPPLQPAGVPLTGGEQA